MNYLAVGEKELGPEAEAILCPTCGQTHPIEYGTSRRLQDDGTWTDPAPSKSAGFYKCQGKLYIGTINGRVISEFF